MSVIEIIYAIFALCCLIALRKEQARNSRLVNKLEDEIHSHRTFKTDVQRLLWNIGNQREKVPGTLSTVIRTMNHRIQYNEEEAYEIKEKIMENIK